MAIRVKCPVCGHVVSAPDGSAGRRGRCPNCSVMIRLPSADELGGKGGEQGKPGSSHYADGGEATPRPGARESGEQP